jgi:hypothetical protein
MLRSIITHGGTSRRNIPAVRDIYERWGVIDMAKKAVAQNIQRASLQLAHLKRTGAREMLAWFSEMLLHRNF